MNFIIEIEKEDDGRWICEIPEIPGAMAYGRTRNEAISKTQSLALRILADRIEHGENVPGIETFFSVAA
ncbi:type II toxin-antitoxin system HicB family antitoxin [Desulfonema magnum]|uniref:Toxin-antitoxin system, antitoxin component, HicB-like n=1 Tax=Desulfonema magnum TaxID=45655 RepID=A0A975BVZ6_9BACT|nr:type II toxin-antitoxin system HicB family antitoxin [Desulfonema magnum]QTA92734.1 Toxin-antitoxin system, antitoxin component, HicB-like [Desulfonema magnum]